MNTTDAGKRAETAAAAYLSALGYEILELNYRKPHCEIDIVACKDEVIYFVEVKYRSSDVSGDGLDYITPRKIMHMQRAASTWVMSKQWEGEFQLSAVSVQGNDFEIIDFIESIY